MSGRLLRYLEGVMRSREPDMVIGGYEFPYVLRWHLIPRNSVLSIYLHLFLRGDEDDARHDHMGDNISWIIEVGYYEEFARRWKLRLPGRVCFRLAETSHRIHLWHDSNFHPPFRPAVTIFVTGPRRRDWGFHCPNGWVHWKKIVGTGHYGARPGCAAFEAAATPKSAATVAVHGQTKSPP